MNLFTLVQGKAKIIVFIYFFFSRSNLLLPMAMKVMLSVGFERRNYLEKFLSGEGGEDSEQKSLRTNFLKDVVNQKNLSFWLFLSLKILNRWSCKTLNKVQSQPR